MILNKASQSFAHTQDASRNCGRGGNDDGGGTIPHFRRRRPGFPPAQGGASAGATGPPGTAIATTPVGAVQSVGRVHVRGGLPPARPAQQSCAPAAALRHVAPAGHQRHAVSAARRLQGAVAILHNLFFAQVCNLLF